MAVKPRLLSSRESSEPPVRLISMVAWHSMRPSALCSACARVSVTKRGGKRQAEQQGNEDDHENPTDKLGCGKGPVHQDDPNSITGLVEASSTTMAAVKLAPLRKTKRPGQ